MSIAKTSSGGPVDAASSHIVTFTPSVSSQYAERESGGPQDRMRLATYRPEGADPLLGVVAGDLDAVRTVAFHLVALALAIGPAVFFGFAVAPQAFRILPTRDLAASLQSPILTVACRLAEGSFAVLFLTSWLLGRWWEAARLTRTLATRAAMLGMITAVVIESLLIPPMDKIRMEAGLLDTLPVTDPSRVLLARYHRLATGFFSAGLVAAQLVVSIAAGVLYPFFGLLLSPMIAAAAMSFSSVSVIGNALRLRRARL